MPELRLASAHVELPLANDRERKRHDTVQHSGSDLSGRVRKARKRTTQERLAMASTASTDAQELG